MTSAVDYARLTQYKSQEGHVVRESPFVYSNGKLTVNKNRSSVSPGPSTKQGIHSSDQVLNENLKSRSKDPTKTGTEFYTKKRSSSTNERDLWARYGMQNPALNNTTAMKNSSSKKITDNRRVSSALRGSSILRSRIERDINMSDQQDPEESQEEINLKVIPGFQKTNKKFSSQDNTREEFSNSNSFLPSFASPDNNENIDFNLTYKGNITKQRIQNAYLKESQDYQKSNYTNISNQEELAEYPQNLRSGVHSRSRDRSPNRPNFTALNSSNQINDAKKIVTGEERKKRINALEKLMEANFSSDQGSVGSRKGNEENIPLEPNRSTTNSSAKKIDDFQEQSNSGLPPAGNHKNFRRNLYKSNNNGEEIRIENQTESKTEPSQLRETPLGRDSNKMIINKGNGTPQRGNSREGDKRVQTHLMMMPAFDRDIEVLQTEQLDVEEIHYFFVNFHQKSKQILSKLKQQQNF